MGLTLKLKKLFNFINKDIKNLNIKKIIEENKIAFLLVGLYILISLMLISSSTLNIFDSDVVRGIAAQIQIILLFYLTLRIKNGFMFALILNVFSFSSITAMVIINKDLSFLPGIITYLTTLIIITAIKNYQEEINLKIKELNSKQEELKYIAYHDNLTEIANRELLIKKLDQLTSKNDKFNLIFIDFNNFKKINDSWGYKIGDDILKEAASRLSQIINKNDFIARMGGDEFAVVEQRNLNCAQLNKYIRKIKRNMEKTFKIEDREISLRSNFGISKFPEDGKNAKDIIKSADIAIYKAKNNPSNDIEFFTENMKNDVVVDVQMEDLLKKALKRDEFHLLFQPQYKTDAREIRGFEALIRWHSPDIGTISPARFIPVAEKSDLIKKIGDWVLETAVDKFKDLEKNFNNKPVLSINISVMQLMDSDFVDNVKEILKRKDFEGFKLEFEITESLFISDQEYVIDVLYKLKELGISIAMDDFGTGYASLSYLQHIPLDTLKIDKSFIDMINNNPDPKQEKMMVAPIIEMAHQWSIEVIAEGVETVEQLHYLEDHNCDYIQGYLLNKPLSEYQMLKVL